MYVNNMPIKTPHYRSFDFFLSSSMVDAQNLKHILRSWNAVRQQILKTISNLCYGNIYFESNNKMADVWNFPSLVGVIVITRKSQELGKSTK
jgi:hypothetical protein